MTAEQMVTHGLCDPVRVFVKNEPHPIAKIEQRRFRLISSVSIVDYCVEKWLSDLQNQVEIRNWHTNPAKPGMGLDDESIHILFHTVAPHALANDLQSTDMSGWDWSVKWWELKFEAEFRATHFSNLHEVSVEAQAFYRTMYLNRYRVSALSVRTLSNGELWAQVTPGIMLSGRNDTSSSNSHIRILLRRRFALQKFTGATTSPESKPFCIAMGDDCVEEVAPGLLDYYEHITGRIVRSEDTRIYHATNIEEVKFQFCSTLFSFDKERNQAIGEPVNWARTFYRLLCQPPVEEFLDQFKLEMRHSPYLSKCLEILDAVGWVTAKFVKQGPSQATLLSMPPKKAGKKKSVKGVKLKTILKKASSVGARSAVKAAAKASKKGVHVARSRPAARTTSGVHADLQRNADGFIASVHKPFSVRGMRFPEPSPFPSSTGSFTQRLPLSPIQDSVVTTQAYFGVMAWPTFNASNAGNGPIWTLSAMANSVPTWTQTAWNNISALTTNFNVIRPVSMAIRFLNTTPMLNRGGVGYVLNTAATVPTTAAALNNILGSEEALEVDLAHIHELGDELCWVPSQFSTSQSSTYSTGSVGYNLYTYLAPGASITPVDNKIFIWGSFPYTTQQTVQLEICVNWEAIPYPATENLFERKVVVGSAADLAVAVEKSGVSKSSTTTWAAFGDAAMDAIGSGASAALSGGGIKGAIAAVLPQVPSLIKKLGAGIASLFSAEDYANHTMAVAMDAVHMSPAHKKEHLGLSKQDFLRLLVEEAYGIRLPELVAKGEEKDYEPSLDLQLTSSSVSPPVTHAPEVPVSGRSNAAVAAPVKQGTGALGGYVHVKKERLVV